MRGDLGGFHSKNPGNGRFGETILAFFVRFRKSGGTAGNVRVLGITRKSIILFGQEITLKHMGNGMRAFRLSGIIVVLLVAFGCAIGGTPSGKAPGFSLKTSDGKVVDLKKLEGKVVVVNFWATWCGPCRREIPGFLEVYEQYKSKGLEIVGISLDHKGWAVVNPYVERVKITYPVVIGDGALADAYGGISAIPTTFIVDKKGNIADTHVGYLTKEELENKIKGLM
jgi:cytochrome c biogenesis protein CcmG/thiol:disulfide interchange protein DsbE